MDWVRHLWCGLRGHDTLLQFEQERMFLRCVSCGHESPGWDMNDSPAPVTVRGEARTQPLVQPPLVSARKVA